MPHEVPQIPQAMLDLIDRAEITDLLSRLGVCFDEGRFDELGDIFTEDVTGDLFGGPLLGRAHLEEKARKALGRCERHQHVIANVIVDLRADQAGVRANLISTHVAVAAEPTAFRQTGSAYEFDARRTPDGWRLSKAAMHSLWTKDQR